MFDRITGVQGNRRNRERRTYRVLQWVAGCPDEGLPKRKAFRQVRCHDISRGGLSYYTEQPPLDELLVVGLGSGGQTTYLKCRVANCVRVDETNGAFRVGCEFICRVELPVADQPTADANTAASAAR